MGILRRRSRPLSTAPPAPAIADGSAACAQCLFHFVHAARLPHHCRSCASFVAAAENRADARLMPHVDHGVPPHSVGTLSEASLRELDAITTVDAALCIPSWARIPQPLLLE